MAMEDGVVLGELLARTAPQDWSGVGARSNGAGGDEHVQAATDRMSRVAALPGWVRDLSAPLLGPRNFRSAFYAPLKAGW